MARFVPLLMLLLLPQSILCEETPQSPAVSIAELERYGERAPPHVPSRKDSLVFYPCSQCHEHWKTNTQRRVLAPVHDVGLEHGRGQLWCLDCHDPEDRDRLHLVSGAKVDFDQSWLVCGQCHSARQKDWYFGAHGKRVENWQGEPVRYNCSHCHDPHRPPFMRRKPMPPPPVRAGLEPMKPREHQPIPVWLRPIVTRPEKSHAG